MFVSNPVNVFYALKGVFYVARQRNVPGRISQLQFWLFSWSNYVMKYKNLKDSDIDIESVGNDFDYKNIIPQDYRESAIEQIPRSKIDAQINSTVKGLTGLIQRKLLKSA